MDAESADNFLRPLENYVGVFSPDLLQNIKIVSYPASILVLTDGHWISLYVTNQTLEIMDSMGYLAKDEISQNLQNFITAHATAKQISTTPQIQTSDSELCSLYAIAFLYFRTFKCGSLCDFCKLFSPDLSLNSKIIVKIFNTIRKINEKTWLNLCIYGLGQVQVFIYAGARIELDPYLVFPDVTWFLARGHLFANIEGVNLGK